jgi:small subunit ribosomal protein S3
VRVDLHTSRPGLIIGRRGQTADWIRGRLQDDFGPLFLNIMETKLPGNDT